MDIHKNPRLTLRSREQLAQFVLSGQTLSAAARRFLVTPKTAAKWVRRFRTLGLVGLHDCSSRPLRSPRAAPAELVSRVIELRRQHAPGYQIALSTGLSPASVSRILRRVHLSRWRDLHPAPPVQRYEHPCPGDLLHLDIKGLTCYQEVLLRADGRRRGLHKHPGFEALHVAIDDHSRLAFTQMLPDQKAETTVTFLRNALDFYARQQRKLLPLSPVSRSLRPARNQTPPHPALHTANQRQGRTIHPDRSARMGLCQTLERLRRTRPAPPALDRLLQLRPPPWLPQLHSTNQ